jgi:hypothetical protein
MDLCKFINYKMQVVFLLTWEKSAWNQSLGAATRDMAVCKLRDQLILWPQVRFSPDSERLFIKASDNTKERKRLGIANDLSLGETLLLCD